MNTKPQRQSCTRPATPTGAWFALTLALAACGATAEVFGDPPDAQTTSRTAGDGSVLDGTSAAADGKPSLVDTVASAGPGSDVAPATSPEPAETDTGPATDTAKPTDVKVPADGAPTTGTAFTPEQWAQIQKLSPLPAVPPDPTNQYADNPKAAALGQKLFYDRGIAAKHAGLQVNCASCHVGPMMDQGAEKAGFSEYGGGSLGSRNPLPVVNAAFHTWTNWGGKFDSQWSLAVAVVENPKIFNSTRLEVAHRIYAVYQAEYDAVFPVPLDKALDPKAIDAARFPPSGKPKASGNTSAGPWEWMTAADQAIVNTIYVNYGKAIAAYMRQCVSGNAPFDQYVAGNSGALTDQAKLGLDLFVGKGGCVGCHSGPLLSDGKFHATGSFGKGGGNNSDLGRYTDVAFLLANPFNSAGQYSDSKATGKLTALQQTVDLKYQFRTPSLRGVALSGPWMHDGMSFTLDSVLFSYASGGGMPWPNASNDPLLTKTLLTDTERAALVAFLQSLNGAAVAAGLLVDTSAPVASNAPTGTTCPGGALCACQKNDECQSALCLETALGKTCAKNCSSDAGCPKDFACLNTKVGSDVVGVCHYKFNTLCDPCTDEAACYVGTAGGKTTCVNDGEVGSYCQNLCDSVADCPLGYLCGPGGKDGSQGKRCKPVGGAACACSPTAIEKGLTTNCTVSAPKGPGACEGVRKCLPAGVFGAPVGGGLSPCVVTTPELPCDNVDNNCDGKIDEVGCPAGKVCVGGGCG